MDINLGLVPTKCRKQGARIAYLFKGQNFIEMKRITYHIYLLAKGSLFKVIRARLFSMLLTLVMRWPILKKTELAPCPPFSTPSW
jgi:hypothetical protein